MKLNSTLVEQARLPLKLQQKSQVQNAVPNFIQNARVGISKSSLASHSIRPINKAKPASQDIQTAIIPQWQLQIVCGPGHDHNNFDSQRAGAKLKEFELIGEKIWRPTLSVLDEPVQCPTTGSSLVWPEFLRFRVLEDTTRWEHWDGLYAKEHYGRKPLMRDCYITHGWNKPTKTPIWLPRDVWNLGILCLVLKKWFPLPKDKVIIIYEFINKDRRQADPEVS